MDYIEKVNTFILQRLQIIDPQFERYFQSIFKNASSPGHGVYFSYSELLKGFRVRYEQYRVNFSRFDEAYKHLIHTIEKYDKTI